MKFQSTRPRGARLVYDNVSYTTVSLFQSTRPRGARPVAVDTMKTLYLFQSTRPRGARLVEVNLLLCVADCFNPRARAGRDDSDSVCSGK